MQSDARLLKCNGLIPYQCSYHIYETKPSNAIGAFLNDITGVCTYYMTQGNVTANYLLDSVNTESIWSIYCIRFINDGLLNLALLLNITEINTNPTYHDLYTSHIPGTSPLIILILLIQNLPGLFGYLPGYVSSQTLRI
jgi:hypothetical protein